jgi:hypothetical protein
MRHRSTVLATLAALAFGTTLLASMDIQKEFVAKYPDAKAKLGRCGTCHTKPMPKKDDFELNAYGKAMEKAVVDPKAAKKSYDFAKIEAEDSDGDGAKNLDEIQAGTNPGAK